jgi:hypothetical protein
VPADDAEGRVTIAVEFPDGSIRDVPSERREIKSREIDGGPSSFYDVPAYDPEWSFEAAMGGKWWASPRR